MDKREKVIKGLELCRYDPDPGQECKFMVSCEICPYFDDNIGCTQAVMFNDALELLKAQEAAEPEIEVLNEIDRIYRCPSCHKSFFYKKQRFCDSCGQAVKWE